MAISPDGAFAYVSSRQDDAVAIFTVDGSTGALGYVGAVLNNPPTVDGLWQNKGVAVSPDGSYLVASGRTDPRSTSRTGASALAIGHHRLASP